MAWSDVSSVILRIGELLTQEATSLWGVEEQVDRLQTELKWMQSFLIDADARRGESESVRLWVSEIRDLAYDAEDVVETFALRIGSKRKGGFSNAVKRSVCILNEEWMLHRIRSEIEEIITKITDLTRRLQTYGIKELRDGEGSSSSYEKLESRRSFPHDVEDNIVGFNDKIKELVSVIIDEAGRNYQVVCICGMGGLGKTTLAKKVYHHSLVRGHFNHLVWVYVSQHCQRRKVWEDILCGLKIMDKDQVKRKREEDLAEMLFNFLKDNKCLVVLDDLWSIQDWDSIKPAFPKSETSSKFLLTSRNKEVASHVNRTSYLHELDCLNEENSWKLFQKIAFPNRDSSGNEVDAKMEEFGKNIVRHCGGMPLAIVVLGGILATKNSLNEWQLVSKNVKSYLKRGKGQGVEDVLELSYDDLPPYLRSCFLYLSHFPEDCEISAERLIQLWIAEGIVLSNQNKGNGEEIVEDVAENYLIELAERCMIQVGERDALLKIKTLHMHDLMRDLCLLKAKQENFLCIIDHSSGNQFRKDISSSTIRGVRRVAAHVFPQVQCIKNPHLRSFLFFFEVWNNQTEALTDPKMIKRVNYILEHSENLDPLSRIFILWTKYILWRFWTYMFNNFKFLRVLYFEGRVYDAGIKLPCDIGNLIHLRFLCLKDLSFFMPKLPASLGSLRCLQTLDLRVQRIVYLNGDVGGPIHVPNVIWRMKQLRHLYLPQHCDPKTKLKLCTLRNLLTLVNFNTRNCYVGDLQNMMNLRDLQIFGSFHIEDFEDLGKNPAILGNNNILRSLTLTIESIEIPDPRHLTHLIFGCANIYELRLVLKIGKLPEYHHFSSNIASIYLRICNLVEDPMPTLGRLPNLRILKVREDAFTGKEMACSAQSFVKLDFLSIYRLHNLEEWKVDEGAMPALRHLEIFECKNLKMLPNGLRFITNLRKLEIGWVPKAFKDKLVEGGEDFYKVQHIPSIEFHRCG
ncbi:PREDICTED: probable disease resistance protein At1g58602 isoform X2 [Theobroma cacao]|nr:PREDICTED: probable disease resistance protein At1g58602 isoform X2 [Theobroma cacao]